MARTSITHLSPISGSGLTGCCGRPPLELASTDLITNDPGIVTCRRKATRRLRLALEILGRIELGAAELACTECRGCGWVFEIPGSPLSRQQTCPVCKGHRSRIDKHALPQLLNAT